MKKIVVGVLAGLSVLSCSACFGCGCERENDVFSSYEITAEYVPENGTLAGTVKLTFENPTDNELSTLKFQLYPNAYREDAAYKPVSPSLAERAYYDGISYGEMVISSVNGAKNWEVMGEDENILYAHLTQSLFPGESVVLDIGFMTKLAKVNHRTGITPRAVNLGNFFPILCGIKEDGFYETAYYALGSPFYSDCADFKVTLKTPKDYVVATSGEVVEERMLESKKQRTAVLSRARDFAVTLSADYRVLEREIGDKTLRYYYYDDTDAQNTLDTATEAFGYFEETFGAYPYPTYTLAQTGLCLDGAEYPALTMLDEGLAVEEKARQIAYQTAKQWWCAAVGSDATENAWQSEGLSAYAALTFFENYEKYGVVKDEAVRESLRDYRSYYDVYGSVLGRTDTKMTRHLRDFISEYEYRCITHDKAVVMFDTLRKSVGDNKFFSALRRYYKDNTFALVGKGELVAAFERTGLDVVGFFDSFLEGVAIL